MAENLKEAEEGGDEHNKLGCAHGGNKMKENGGQPSFIDDLSFLPTSLNDS